MGWIKSYWQNNPLTLILWIALLLRLVAAIFSKGYGMHDDHFLVIETAQSWLDRATYNNWFIERENGATPTILNFFYAGFHYILFYLLEGIGISGPQAKMFIVRTIHGLWSLLIVLYAFRITEKLSGRPAARMTALFMAALWLMPFFSVRNLVEMVCIPFLLAGSWLVIKETESSGKYRGIFYASLLFGMAFILRFQTLIFPAGIGLVLLYRKKYIQTVLLASGIILVFLVTHGVADWIIWGRPFKEIEVYISHNITHRFDYTSSPWYTYILVLVGALIPPVSLFLFAGFFRSWKKYLLLFLPTLLFLLFHSIYPNKQERFILPALPFFIMLGLMGGVDILQRVQFWKRNTRSRTITWAFFWSVNLVMLFFFSTMYSKRARVESMVYLSNYKDIGLLVTEDIHRAHAPMLPLFYLEQWPRVVSVSEQEPMDKLKDRMLNRPGDIPAFILFFDERDLESRVAAMKELFPGIVEEKKVQPGLPDKVLHWLNPVNANQTVNIYRNTQAFPLKAEK